MFLSDGNIVIKVYIFCFQSYPSYAFEYAVRDPHTGDNKAQWEKRDGDTVTGI